MVERKKNIAPKSEFLEIRPFPASESHLRTRRERNQSERLSVDDVIGSLSDSYENRRARQVVEWVRQQGSRRAAV